VAVAQGKLDDAARAYGDGLAIRKQLTAGDPNNTQWQRDLSVSHWELADLPEWQNKTDAAHGYSKQALDVLSGIEERGLHLSPEDSPHTVAPLHPFPVRVGTQSVLSRAAIASNESRSPQRGFRRSLRIKASTSASPGFDPNGFRPSHRPVARRLRSRAARSLATMTLFSRRVPRVPS
jgi:hypothetical protein